MYNIHLFLTHELTQDIKVHNPNVLIKTFKKIATKMFHLLSSKHT